VEPSSGWMFLLSFRRTFFSWFFSFTPKFLDEIPHTKWNIFFLLGDLCFDLLNHQYHQC
jgi:hypothetical protein